MQSYYDIINYFPCAVYYVMEKCLEGSKELDGEMGGEKVGTVECLVYSVGTWGQLRLAGRLRSRKAREYEKQHPADHAD